MFACDELHFASGAQCMVHKPLCIAWGNANDFKDVIAQLDKCEESILDIYMEHAKDGVSRETIQSLVENETWMNGNEVAQYFDVEIEEQAAVAACASDFFEKYNNIPENLKKTSTQDVVNAVIAALDAREKDAKEKAMQQEKEQLLADLDEYGI